MKRKLGKVSPNPENEGLTVPELRDQAFGWFQGEGGGGRFRAQGGQLVG